MATRVEECLPAVEGDVVVRRLRHEDAELFAEGTEDPAVREHGHLPLSGYTPEIVREQIDGVIAKGLAEDSLAVLAIADAASGSLLGSIVLFDFRETRAEVGYWVGPWARGAGTARKALQAVVRVARDAGLRHLEARTNPDNEPSWRVLERVGFSRSGGVRLETAPSGALVDVLTYTCAVDAADG